jgi:2-oxoglutarate dehydrogenase E2 component (dihydrolipoamide succinyltransferase)
MPTPVVMPQMGESIAEGTIVRWMKKVGDPVVRDEPLFEISTDKVDAEIPSPAEGILAEIVAKEGDTVPVNFVVATIAQADEIAGAAEAAPDAAGVGPAAGAPRPAGPPGEREEGPAAGADGAPALEEDDDSRQKSSPLVRRIAREHGVDLGRVTGSGVGGRITKADILRHVAGIEAGPEGRAPTPGSQGGERVEIRPLSPMRKTIAERMVLSQRTSAHVHSVFHVSFSTVDRLRQEKKAEFERAGLRLTYMAFIVSAVGDALTRHPAINASIDGDNVVYRRDVHIGVAVALDTGLIVPVIRHADRLDLAGLSRAIADLADRARQKRLSPDQVQGGTFTITNPGQYGSQFGLPIINQPQVAILGVGAIEKRPVVVDDAIGVRLMAYLTLGFDHRLVDGAAADQFMTDVKRNIEHFAL